MSSTAKVKMQKISASALKRIASEWRYYMQKWSIYSPWKAVHCDFTVKIVFNTKTKEIGAIEIDHYYPKSVVLSEDEVFLRPTEYSYMSEQVSRKSLISCIRQACLGFRRLGLDGHPTCVVSDADTPACWQKKVF